MSFTKVVLASASPRRKELLKLILDDFTIHPSDFDESLISLDIEPQIHVQYSSEKKAMDVAMSYSDCIIIGADTIVCVDNEILGKPENKNSAFTMLQKLSGRKHQVYTGLTVIHKDLRITTHSCTDVTFRKLTDDLIESYIETGEPMDKAGAYAIQKKGAVLVESICGCFYNVVGLPVNQLSLLLEKFGIEPLRRPANV
jgi:septum formation protein